MARFGYTLSSEEWGPDDLVWQAVQAQDAGFESLGISDHFHPWNDEQGQSPFVWGVLGAISREVDLPISTHVTAPIMRIHPAIVAQAAATASLQFRGQFVLGVGSGEALNEQILGDLWPLADERLDMLEEAVEILRALWSGEVVTHHGEHYAVEWARLYSSPTEPIPVYVSAFGPKALELAGRIGDGLVSTSPDTDAIKTFRKAGEKASRRLPVPRSAMALIWTPRSKPRTGCGPTPGCPASFRKISGRRPTSCRRPHWSPPTRSAPARHAGRTCKCI